MKIIKGKKYLLSWKSNPSFWNDNLIDLKRKHKVVEKNKRYYTVVIAQMTGDFYIVDCTTDDHGNTHPVNCELLKKYP